MIILFTKNRSEKLRNRNILNLNFIFQSSKVNILEIPTFYTTRTTKLRNFDALNMNSALLMSYYLLVNNSLTFCQYYRNSNNYITAVFVIKLLQ